LESEPPLEFGHRGDVTLRYVNTQMSQQGYNSSLSGRTNAEENRQKFSDENGTSTT